MLGGTIAGYRVVRKLGAGSRADVFLGSGTTGTVALKVFHPETSRDSIGNELDALGRLDSRHLVRFRDVETDEDGTPILILDRVHRGSVAALLRDRDSLEAGEVVTLLAPLAGVLPVMHRAGVAHGRIGASTLHLGAGGEPVLLGFGHSELFARDGSAAAIDVEPAAARDREALASLAIALVTHVRGAGTDGRVGAMIEWIDAAPREFEFCERLEARLFDFADPVPLEFGVLDSARSEVPGRLGDTARVASRLQPTEELEAAPAAVARRPSGVIGWVDSALRENPIELAKGRLLTFSRGVRKPFWVAAGLGMVGLVLAVALVPQGSAPAPPTASDAADASTAVPTPSALPTDPLEALPLLLAERSECIRSLSILCLDGVDDQTSSAYTVDSALIQQLQAGGETPSTAIVTAAAPSLVEKLGDSAIVKLGPNDNPASVLMMQTAAGWRIRGYLSGIPSTGTPAD